MQDKTNIELVWKMLVNHASFIDFDVSNIFHGNATEAESVNTKHIPKVYELYEKYGKDGINAFCAYQREEEMKIILNSDNCHGDVMPQFRTANYYKAKEQLKKEKYEI